MRAYILNGNYEYKALFEALGFTITKRFEEADLAVFTGGADVTPSYYGDKPHPRTFNDVYRDKEEEKYFQEFLKNGVPMVGICRGGQFLNVMSGGRMYQHVSNHTRSHSITDVQTGETIYVSSTHHQMMMPSEKAEIVAVASEGGYREWFDGPIARRDMSEQDIEVVHYAHTNALCFQPHPEFSGAEYESMKRYFKDLLSRYLGV